MRHSRKLFYRELPRGSGLLMTTTSKLVLALDEGTTSARAILFDLDAEVRGIGQYEFPQYYPKPGWVEHDPEEIWAAQMRAWRRALREAGVEPRNVIAIGVTNQRETTVMWDSRTGRPIHNAIVWQDRRTAQLVDELREEYAELFVERTGLIPDSYFSAVKVKWLLDSIGGLREKAEKGYVKFGTIDSFLIWRLSGGRLHVTDYSNASRTMLFNIRKLEWDEELLEVLQIPEAILPEPLPSSEVYGYTAEDVFGAEVPIAGDAGDQQAALFGQACFKSGMVKCTYGTGNFVLMNVGTTPSKSAHGLLSTVAWGLERGRATYALEGSIFITGAAVQWLRDMLGIISNLAESEELASSVPDTGGVFFVPAFVGLGAPYWDQYARGLIIGITRGTSKAHLVRAALEAIAYQTRDVLEAMEKDAGIRISELRVDGGASRNDFLMQFQADIANVRVVRPVVYETTALGAAYLAGLAVGYWSGIGELEERWKIEKVFEPRMDSRMREALYGAWREAVRRAGEWAKIIEWP